MQLVGLNPEEHGAVMVRPVSGETRRFVEIVAAEFAAAAACCPVLFVKSADTGGFYAGAMFGFSEGAPLITEPGQSDPFVPLDRKRAGFFISGDHIAIDPDHDRFSTTEGEPLFHGDGSPAPALRAIQAVLTQLHRGKAETDAFIERMLALKLIEPIHVSLSFDDGEKLVLQGLYTIGLDGLAELDDATVLELFRAGHLQLAYTVALSARQIPVLASRHNARLAADAPRP